MPSELNQSLFENTLNKIEKNTVRVRLSMNFGIVDSVDTKLVQTVRQDRWQISFGLRFGANAFFTTSNLGN